MSAIPVKISSDIRLVDFLTNNGTMINIGDDQYLHMPFWFKVDLGEEVSSTITMYSMDNLPVDLVEYVKQIREQK